MPWPRFELEHFLLSRSLFLRISEMNPRYKHKMSLALECVMYEVM
jgi:hypothetical protein